MPADTNLREPIGAGQKPSANGDLDEALDKTFPASDPVSMIEPGGSDRPRPVVTPEVEARQGVTGHNVRYVLWYGILGTVIAFAIIYLVFHS